jgi:hypothetical protein
MSNFVKYIYGTSNFPAVSSGGTSVVNGTPNAVLYENASGKLTADPLFTIIDDAVTIFNYATEPCLQVDPTHGVYSLGAVNDINPSLVISDSDENITVTNKATKVLIIGAEELWVDEGYRAKITDVSTNYDVEKSDYWINADADNGAITIRIDTAYTPELGKIIYIADMKGTCNGTKTITLTTTSRISGATSLVLNGAFSAAGLIFNGTEWMRFLRT